MSSSQSDWEAPVSRKIVIGIGGELAVAEMNPSVKNGRKFSLNSEVEGRGDEGW